MGRLINWYTVELERLLKNDLSSDRLAETLAEVEAHLTESAESQRESCQHGEDPEELAISRFGSPSRFATDLVLREKEKPYWRAAIVPCLATLLWFWNLLLLNNVASNGLLMVPAFIAMIVIAIASWRNRRTSLLAMCAFSFISFLVWSGALAIERTMYENKEVRYQRTVFIPSQISKLEEDQKWLNKGMLAFNVSDPKDLPAEFRTQKGYVVGIQNGMYGKNSMARIPNDTQGEFGKPRQSHYVIYSTSGSGERQYVSFNMGSWHGAKKWWTEEAPKAVGSVNTALSNLAYSKDYYAKVVNESVLQRFGKYLTAVPRMWFWMFAFLAPVNLIFALASQRFALYKMRRRQLA